MLARARARIGSSALAENGGIAFFAATGAANLANFLFHVAMSRMLGPATYGALGSILGLSTVVVLGATAAQAAVTQAVAARPLAALRLGRSLRRTGGLGVALLVALVAAAPLLRGFLHLSSVVPVLLFGVFAAATVTSLVPQGMLIGRLRFGTVATALAVGAGLRLATGPVFVALGWGLSGAVAATVVHALATLALLLWPLRAELAGRGAVEEFRFRPAVALLAVVALGGVSAFVGADTFLARHFLSRTGSGYYAAAATAARIALFLPAAVGMLAFPRLVATGGRGPEARQVLVHALAAVAVLGGAAALVIVAVPRTLVDVLFGARYLPATGALRVLAVAAAAVGVATVGVYALLARRSLASGVAWPALGALAAGVALVHHSTGAVAWVVLSASAGLLLLTLVALAGGAVVRPARPGRSVASRAGASRAAGPGTESIHTGRRLPADSKTGTHEQ